MKKLILFLFVVFIIISARVKAWTIIDVWHNWSDIVSARWINEWMAQTFIAPYNFNLTWIEVRLSNPETPDCNYLTLNFYTWKEEYFDVSLWNVLTSSTIDISWLWTYRDWFVNVPFSEYFFTWWELYAFSITGDWSNCFWIYQDNYDIYSSWHFVYHRDWIWSTEIYDMYFKIYWSWSAPTPPEPPVTTTTQDPIFLLWMNF